MELVKCINVNKNFGKKKILKNSLQIFDMYI